MKNALAAFGLGGAGGGSDFDPRGKTENEVILLRFSQSCISYNIFLMHQVCG